MHRFLLIVSVFDSLYSAVPAEPMYSREVYQLAGERTTS
jgi:hypothetical protein